MKNKIYYIFLKHQRKRNVLLIKFEIPGRVNGPSLPSFDDTCVRLAHSHSKRFIFNSGKVELKQVRLNNNKPRVQTSLYLNPKFPPLLLSFIFPGSFLDSQHTWPFPNPANQFPVSTRQPACATGHTPTYPFLLLSALAKLSHWDSHVNSAGRSVLEIHFIGFNWQHKSI